MLDRPDVAGMAVNIAARLHKLLPNEPGYIFLDQDTARHLDPELRGRCSAFGRRTLKGVGDVPVVSLDWDDARTYLPTEFAAAAATASGQTLRLRAAGAECSFQPAAAPVTLGRSQRQCSVLVDGTVVSGRHAELYWEGSAWGLRDVSRNGTWLRPAAGGADVLLQGRATLLCGRGLLSLGKPFGDPPDPATLVEFELGPAC
jgi:hypothetical protein